ncbi:MAG: type II toxin-antitoxin system RelE/ParE family toxin [Prolixibacteraceae bacterium]|nr:type II toxin-antitoxin system RelE/ParE family toxin [Prolixibacteraceae bacterium]MDD2856520.1 type II toxin-antitoxin system RelE/ParE family toxin [Desulfuromonadaceae bacterium]
MEQTKFILTVNFYCTEAGNEPVRDWLKELPRDDKRIIGEDIKTAQLGWPLGMPLIRKMDKNLWEVRSSLPDGIARVLFTVDGCQMILLHGFIKKSNKTPQNELKTARTRLGNYWRSKP